MQASVQLVFTRLNGAVAYRDRMQTWLSQLGIGAATVIARPVTVFVEHANAPFAQTINPDFLRSLLQVSTRSEADVLLFRHYIKL